MAKITVMLFTTLRKKLGVSKLMLEGETVKDLIEALREYKKPDVDEILINDEGNVNQHFVLTLNSEILDNRKLDTVKIKENDILNIFPPVSGG
ncbi:MAG: MoaD/ThiS family protein [Elusimicrobiales bacterium]|nr:MoaD/ThiS family protein [Elusimicrobiales bacterium]